MAGKPLVSQEIYQKLLEARQSKDLTLKPLTHLKQTYTALDGTEKEVKLRYYQVIGVMHLVLMKRFVLGDDCGLGKTICAITALCLLWDLGSKRDKVIIVTDKSAVLQWVSEFSTFTQGVTALAYMGSSKERATVLEAWQAQEGPSVLVVNYALLRMDFSRFQGLKDYIFICDEAQAFKNPESQIHQACLHLASSASRCWALTASLIENRLLEGFGIYRVVVPGLFSSQREFMFTFSIVEMMQLPGRRTKIPQVKGYTRDHIKAFKEKIDPFYLGRSKADVAKELPNLILKTVEVPMSPFQDSKYQEILNGILELDSGDIRETTKLTQITICQQIIDHPSLLGFEGQECPRLDALIDLVTEGEFQGKKVIVSSRFKTMIDRIMVALAKAKVKAVRITGDEDNKAREKAKVAFSDPSSGVQVICITNAAKQAVNLQAAEAIIFYDTDFSGGVYLQKIGRMIRIGSTHTTCYAVHLVAVRHKGRGAKTIDHRCMEILQGKMKLIESVLGRGVASEQDSVEDLFGADDGKDVSNLFDALRDDAKKK